MTERAPKTPIDEALQRRISDAMSTDDGLAGDPDLRALISDDRGAGGYAKDLARINKWLVSWPVPEPSDEAFEALATRIEQRLGETLPGAASTFFGPPDFDDDDATRDATAGLLGPAPRAVLAGAKKGTLVGMPSPSKNAAPPPGSPLAPLKALAPLKPLGSSKPLGALGPSKPLVARPLGAKPASGLDKGPLEKSPLAKKIAEAKAAGDAGEASKIAPANIETSELAKPELAKPELAKPELAKPELAKPETEAATKAEPSLGARTTDDLPVITSGELELVATPSIPPEPISIPPEAISIPPGAAVAAPTAAPPPPPAPPSAKKKKRKSKAPPAMPPGELIEDRISFPMPPPMAPLPVTDLSAARVARDKDESKGGGWWPLLAAAAVIGLAVAGGMTLFGGGRTADEPMSATATLAPTEDSEEDIRGGLAASAPAAAPVAPVAPPASVPEVPAGASIAPATAAVEVAEAEAMLADDALARDDASPIRRARRGASEPRSAVASASTALGGSAGSGAGGGGSTGARRSGEAAGPSATAPSTGTASSSGSTASGGSSIGSARGGSGSATEGATRAPAPTGPVPESPSRDAVRDALEGVRPQVQACFGEEHGLAEVVVIAVSSGRVTTATVSGRFAGTPVGSCIARAVRGARMPPFSNDRFEVHYQYRY